MGCNVTGFCGQFSHFIQIKFVSEGQMIVYFMKIKG